MKYFVISPVDQEDYEVVCSGDTVNEACMFADQVWCGPDKQNDRIDEIGYDEYMMNIADCYTARELGRAEVLEYVEWKLDGNGKITIIL